MIIGAAYTFSRKHDRCWSICWRCLLQHNIWHSLTVPFTWPPARHQASHILGAQNWTHSQVWKADFFGMVINITHRQWLLYCFKELDFQNFAHVVGPRTFHKPDFASCFEVRISALEYSVNCWVEMVQKHLQKHLSRRHDSSSWVDLTAFQSTGAVFW